MNVKNGCRGKRPPSDVLLISGFVRSYIPQVCSFLSDNDLQDLYDEIDWITISDNEVLFLQNDPGDHYYLVGMGSVNLYYEEDDYVSASLSRGCHLGSFVGQFVVSDPSTRNVIFMPTALHNTNDISIEGTRFR